MSARSLAGRRVGGGSGGVRGEFWGDVFVHRDCGCWVFFFIGSYRRWKVAKPLIIAGFAGVMVVGCQWALSAQLWAGAIGYRRFVLLCSLPLVAMAFVHWCGCGRRLDRDGGELARWTLVGIAWVFAIVFGVQVAVWRGEVARLEQALQGAQSKVITLEEVPWARKTALDHWGATMLSVVIQGREPKAILPARAHEPARRPCRIVSEWTDWV